MLTFKKELNLSLLLILLLFLFKDTCHASPVYKQNLRVPLSSQNGMTRRATLAGLVSGAALKKALGQVLVYDTPTLLTEIGFSIDAVYGNNNIPAMTQQLNEFFRKTRLSDFQDRYKSIKTNEDYGARLRSLLEELFLAYNTDKGRGYKGPPSTLLMQLISGFNTEHNIFEAIEASTNIDKNVKKRIINEFLRCSSKAMLGYISLESIGVDNVYGATSPEHVFTVIGRGEGLYIIADFSVGVFRIIDVSESSKQYYREGNYCFLKDSYKISDDNMAILRAKFKREGLAALNNFSEKEIINLFYPHIYISPRLDSEGRRKGVRSVVRMERGLAFEDIGFTGEALKEYEEARKSDPACSEVLTNFAKGFLSVINIGRRKGMEKEREAAIRGEALKMLKEAVRLNPMNPAAYNGLGNIESLQANWEEAIKYFTESLKLDGQSWKSIGTYCNLGDAYRLSGRLQAARKVYEDGLKVFSQDPMLIFKLGLTFYESGDYKEADSQFKKAQKLTEGRVWDIWYWQGMNYLKLPGNNEDKAVQCFVLAVRLNKESLSLLTEKQGVSDSIRQKVERELGPALVSKIGYLAFPALTSL
ncbi:MAG: tetratricopeptide repeat protein [Candidatus Omnitrophota bacterium]|mgnify:CR=1 FL=1